MARTSKTKGSVQDMEGLALVKSLDRAQKINFARSILGIDLENSEDLTDEQLDTALIDNWEKRTADIAKISQEHSDLPVGYARVEIFPGNGTEWGVRTRSMCFLNVQGATLLLKRGVVHDIPIKFLNCLESAIEKEYVDANSEPNPYGHPQPLLEQNKYAYPFRLIAINRDPMEEVKRAKALEDGLAAAAQRKVEREARRAIHRITMG